jgi:pyruvate carboxylase subunit B
VGDAVQAGEILGYIEAMKTFNAIRTEKAGTITAILANSGDAVEEDDPIMKLA